MLLQSIETCNLCPSKRRPNQGATVFPELAIRSIDTMVEKWDGDSFSQRLQPPIIEVCCPNTLNILYLHCMDHALSQVIDLVGLAIFCEKGF